MLRWLHRRREAKRASDLVRWGYWPAMRMHRKLPSAVRYPNEYEGHGALAVACTQTGLPASQQRKLVAEWCEFLPSLNIHTLEFSSRSNQKMLEAAARIRTLRALSIKWSSMTDLGPLEEHPSLEALFVGSSPSLADLEALKSLRKLRYLFVQNVPAVRGLSFLGEANSLLEFGIGGPRGKPPEVSSLQPIAKLKMLKTLWFVGGRSTRLNVEPLLELQALESFRTSWRPESREVQMLKKGIPSLKYMEPVFS